MPMRHQADRLILEDKGKSQLWALRIICSLFFNREADKIQTEKLLKKVS